MLNYIVNKDFSIPNASTNIYKDECVFTFDNPESSGGIFICLKNFFSLGSSVLTAYSRVTGNFLFLNYKITKVYKHDGYKNNEENEIKRPTKLALGVEGGFELPIDKYDLIQKWSLFNSKDMSRIEIPTPPDQPNPNDLKRLSNFPKDLAECILFVQTSESAILKEEREQSAALWEDENLRPVSKFSENLVQLPNGVKIHHSGWKCCKCDLKENLWLNLSDGAILCGRKFWDGSGGNNHAIEHYEATKYPLTVKLGTITPEGAEVYSYGEEEMVTDSKLKEHLEHWGIDIMKMEKSDKTLAELEIVANERLGEWLLLQEADKKLEPRWGPGMTGLRNLGNSCYLNTAMQALFAMSPFRCHYAYNVSQFINSAIAKITTNQDTSPINNFPLQLAKLGHAMTSGAYSWCQKSEETLNAIQNKGEIVPPMPGLKPSLFRRIVGRGHREFSTKRLQDSHEFLEHVFSLIESDISKSKCNSNPLQAIEFSVEERIECGQSHKVRYSESRAYTLTLQIPLEAAINKEAVELCKRQSEQPNQPNEQVKLIIPFESCLSYWCGEEKIDDWISPVTKEQTFALRSQKLKNFPEYLIIHVARFKLGPNWQPVKLDVEISINNGDPVSQSPKSLIQELNSWRLDLSGLRAAGGLQSNEESMPEDLIKKPTFEPNPEIISALMDMGFSLEACKKACKHTNNAGIEVAMEWVFSRIDDPDLNKPEPSQSSLSHVDPSAVETLCNFGLNPDQATAVLLKFNNLENAADWVLNNPEQAMTIELPTKKEDSSIGNHQTLSDGQPIYEIIGLISHMGKTTTEGHYVCHLKRSALSTGVPGFDLLNLPAQCQFRCPEDSLDSEWLIFNDEKVAKSEAPPFKHAYMYIFRRIDATKND